MTSKKPLIIKAISEMNISLLEVLLDDNQTYQGATKETFLEKMDEVFEQFKKSKDIVLSPFAGFCKSKSCENKGCTGLAFLGNVSNISMDLIFDEADNNFKDIYRCSKFKINDKSIEPIGNYRIDVMYDEKSNFNPTPERLKIFQECKKAFNEIIKSNNITLTKDSLLKWIDDYYWVREELKNNTCFLPFIYRSIDNFRDLYNDLNNVVKYIQFEIQAFNALADIQKIDFFNKNELWNWLVTYENLRYDLSKLVVPFDSYGIVKMNYLRIRKQPKVRIDLADFSNIMQFKNDFDKYNAHIKEVF